MNLKKVFFNNSFKNTSYILKSDLSNESIIIDVPEDPYPQGIQAKLDEDGKETENDEAKLQMQQKPVGKTQLVQKSEHTFSTETPRPNSALETVDKSFSKDFSPILKDAREQGYEGLSIVAQNILSGKYYKPTPEEIGGF